MPPSLRVLLVEDDLAFAAALATELQAVAPEIELLTRTSIETARKELLTWRPDAVLLDLGLPDSHGLDSLAAIQAVTRHGVPIVILTGLDNLETAYQAMEAGAQDYLVKGPVDAEAIARALRHSVHRAQRTEAALRDTEAQLRQAQKMEAIGRLAGGVAHDFNNVLTAIFGYADLLLDSLGEQAPQRADIEEIKRAAQRAANLTRQLLAFSRRQVLQTRRLNLNHVIAGLQPLLSRLIGEDIQLRVDMSAELGDVEADPGQVEQVLMNLAANARDAMPEGGTLTIRTSNDDLGYDDADALVGIAAGSFVKLSVSDTGGGIPEEARPHIFEPFFTTKEEGKGTGLGLATVYGIVKQSGGWIYLDPAAHPEGATFSIYLPRLTAAAATSSL